MHRVDLYARPLAVLLLVVWAGVVGGLAIGLVRQRRRYGWPLSPYGRALVQLARLDRRRERP
ncbi:MAG: hypothetical protein LC792_00945 [Actinobacteria bacterium]|nr:hypothetical protein [Actinomycetota bacterium]